MLYTASIYVFKIKYIHNINIKLYFPQSLKHLRQCLEIPSSGESWGNGDSNRRWTSLYISGTIDLKENKDFEKNKAINVSMLVCVCVISYHRYSNIYFYSCMQCLTVLMSCSAIALSDFTLKRTLILICQYRFVWILLKLTLLTLMIFVHCSFLLKPHK